MLCAADPLNKDTDAFLNSPQNVFTCRLTHKSRQTVICLMSSSENLQQSDCDMGRKLCQLRPKIARTIKPGECVESLVGWMLPGTTEEV